MFLVSYHMGNSLIITATIWRASDRGFYSICCRMCVHWFKYHLFIPMPQLGFLGGVPIWSALSVYACTSFIAEGRVNIKVGINTSHFAKVQLVC